MSELKQCPFCGSEPIVYYWIADDYAECKNKDCIMYAEKIKLIYWNAPRPIEDELQARIDELESKLKEYGKYMLYQLMLEISEDEFCCGWYDELTFVCKNAVEGKRKMSADYVEKLVEFHELAGGWWSPDPDSETGLIIFVKDEKESE